MEVVGSSALASVGKSNSMKTILLVEDDISLAPIWRLLVNKLSEPCQLTWVTSEAAAERAIAARAARGEHFDLIVCDIFLSGNKTGLDIWRAHRSEPTKFVFASGVATERLEKILSKEGAEVPLLPKPFDPRAGLKMLEEAMGMTSNC